MLKLSISKNPIFATMLFVVSVIGAWSVQPTSSVSAVCGIHTGNYVADFAGAIVELEWQRYSDGAVLEARDLNAYIENADWRGDSDTWQGGNIVRLESNRVALAGQGVDSGYFREYDSGCGDGHNVVFGTTATSGRDTGGGVMQWGPWALDCDATTLGYGDERWFRVRGDGVPAGARAGGTWTVVTFQAKNGATTYHTSRYIEPPPPDSLPTGALDLVTCTTIYGWARDPDYSGSIRVHIYIGGPVGAGGTIIANIEANRARGDLVGANANKAFEFTVPSAYFDGATRGVYAYAIGVNSSGSPNGTWILLSGSPRTHGSCGDYELDPNVTANPSGTIVGGTAASFTHTVTKTGNGPSPVVSNAVKQYVIPPGRAFNMSGTDMMNVATNCDERYYSPPDPINPALCATSTQMTSRTFPAGTTTVVTNTVDTSSMAAGTRLCQIFAVSPSGQSGTVVSGSRWSSPACVTIAKKPYVSVYNGDVWVGGSYRSSTNACPVSATSKMVGTQTTFPDGRRYGAFVEYGIQSIPTVTDFGSAGKPRAPSIGDNLTFRNIPVASDLGNFRPSPASHCLTDAYDYYGTRSGFTSTILGPQTLNISPLNNVIRKSGPGLLTINATSQFSTNKHLIIIAEGDILINANIEFAQGPYTNLASVPSIVMISRTGNISVAGHVTRIDGFYQARNNFITCAEGEAYAGIGESTNVCKQQLTVNGAVSASKVITKRITGGSFEGLNDLRNTPAEKFIMRPDLFLSEYGQSQQNGQLRTVDENELPPRY